MSHERINIIYVVHFALRAQNLRALNLPYRSMYSFKESVNVLRAEIVFQSVSKTSSVFSLASFCTYLTLYWHSQLHIGQLQKQVRDMASELWSKNKCYAHTKYYTNNSSCSQKKARQFSRSFNSPNYFLNYCSPLRLRGGGYCSLIRLKTCQFANFPYKSVRFYSI